MKAAVCRAFGEPLTIEEISLSEPIAGAVRVRLGACAICHSDLSYADGIWGGELPAVYGHEGAGIVEAVGEGVTKCEVGDHVIVTLIRHCGECHYCARAAEPLCEGEFALSKEGPIRSKDGSQLLQAMNSGAFAEAVVVDQSQIEKVPADMPFDVASLLACGVLTGYGAVMNASSLVEGETAIVIGCGGVGLNSVQAACIKGASAIIAMDLEPDKLEVARSFGATHGVLASDPLAVEEVMKITGGRGADHVFVTVGSKRAIESAQSFITKTGSVIVVGMPADGVEAVYDPGSLTGWSQKIIGTKMGNASQSRDVADLIAHYQAGRLKLDELISGRFSLEQVNEALAGVRDGRAVKNVIVFDDPRSRSGKAG